MRGTPLIAISILATTAMLAACETYPPDWAADPYGPFRYEGSEWQGARAPYHGDLRGAGLDVLDPWLKETLEGRTIVTLGFREAGRGNVSVETAHRANIWFRRYADRDRDMKITDPEIRTALVQAARRYLP